MNRERWGDSWSELDDDKVLREASDMGKELFEGLIKKETHPRIAATALGMAWVNLIFACDVPVFNMNKACQTMAKVYETKRKEKNKNENESRRTLHKKEHEGSFSQDQNNS